MTPAPLDTLDSEAVGQGTNRVHLTDLPMPTARTVLAEQPEAPHASSEPLPQLAAVVPDGVPERLTDRYGRTVADIQLGSLNVNQQMVKDGYAWAYRRYGGTRYAPEEKAARKAKLGLWRDANPIEPSQWRKMNK